MFEAYLFPILFDSRKSDSGQYNKLEMSFVWQLSQFISMSRLRGCCTAISLGNTDPYVVIR